MILQRQFSLWKSFGMLLGISIIIMLGSVLFFKWRIGVNQKTINQISVQINGTQTNIQNIKNKNILKKIEMADIIKNKMNNTNYVALYTYLNNLKNQLVKDLDTTVGYKKFTLSVRQGEVDISTQVANYSDLYANNNGIFNVLRKRPFITHISVNSYKSQNNAIYFDLRLKTK